METKVTKISGDTFEGLDGHKGYFLTFTADEKEQKATVTNDETSLSDNLRVGHSGTLEDAEDMRDEKIGGVSTD